MRSLYKRPSQREDGQVSVAVLVLAVLVLAIGIGLMVLGQASDARGKAQKSSDAAALGAAEAVKGPSLVQLAMQQVPPSSPAENGVPYSLLVHNFGAGNGYPAAVRYAGDNSDSMLTHYMQSPGYGQTRIDVETLSEEMDVVGTGDVLTGAPQGDGAASAEVRIKDGVSCTRNGVWEPSSGTLVSWELRCQGSFGSVSVNYVGDTAALPVNAAVALDPMFDIRLIN